MEVLNLDNPVFVTYIIAAALTVLKVMGQGWMTVYRLMKSNSGFASPEDARSGLLNKSPSEGQLELNDYVDRSRRMHRNDLENIPAFWVAGFMYIWVAPSLLWAQIALFGFVVARILHAVAYATKQSHEVRATFYTIGSLIVIYMATHAIIVAL